LPRNCLLKRVFEGKIEGRMEVTGIRVRKRKKLLDDLKEKRGYWKLKEGRTSSQSVENSLWKRLWTSVRQPTK
jgi:hypothetical protein